MKFPTFAIFVPALPCPMSKPHAGLGFVSEIMQVYKSINNKLRLGGCLRAPGPQAPAQAQSPIRTILELSDAKFAWIFGVILMFQNQRFLPQNFWFEL